MNKYQQILTFIAVAEEHSFTRAAKRLSITTTAVSKQIKLLEQQLGQQLLVRDTRNTLITEVGEQFYSHCKRIEEEMQAAENFIQAQTMEPQGTLRILCSLMFAQSHLVNYLYEFHQLYPRVQLNIELADRIPDMEREHFDLLVGFRIYPETLQNLRQRPLYTTKLLLCASPSYLQKNGTPLTIEDLMQHKLLNHPLRQPNNLIQFADGKEVYMPAPEIIINSVDGLITLCSKGVGMLLVGEIQVRDLLRQKQLIVVLPNHPINKVSLNLFYRFSEYEQRKVRCFIDFLLEKMKTT
jgi:DNA-binding transcriptional LysR family regulator